MQSEKDDRTVIKRPCLMQSKMSPLVVLVGKEASIVVHPDSEYDIGEVYPYHLELKKYNGSIKLHG